MTFHLDLHAWVEAQQTAHGVRHDDYGQYHGYCTRRLSRLSHQQDAKQYLIHSSKYASPLPANEGEDDKAQSENKSGNKKSKKKGGGTRHAFVSRSHDTFALKTTGETATQGDSPTAANDEPLPVPHVNILWYLLISAERSWAHSNQLQKSGKARRQQCLKKLKRATEWANLLLEKCKFGADASTVKECEAYCAWMSANYAMEKTKFEVSDHTRRRSF
jgi:hypothetical protein